MELPCYSPGWQEALDFWNHLLVPDCPLSPHIFESYETLQIVAPQTPCPIAGKLLYSAFKSQTVISTAPRQSSYGVLVNSDSLKMPALSCCLLNTRSLVKHGLEVADYILTQDIDIMFITESWLHEAANPAVPLAVPDNYQILRADRSCGGGGGVAIILRDSFQQHAVSSGDLDQCEHLLIKIEVNANTSVICLLLYRPPPDSKQFTVQLSNILSHILKPNTRMLICGDFNAWAENPLDLLGVNLKAMFDSFGFRQHVKDPTQKHGNILDWVLSHNVDITSVCVLPCIWSDHFFVKFRVPLDILTKKPVHKREIRLTRNISKIDIVQFGKMLLPQLDALTATQEVDLIASTIRDALNNTTDTLAPVKRKVCKTETTKKTWFSEDIINLRNTKRRAEACWRRHPSVDNRDAYKIAARGYKDAIILAKSNAFNNRILEARSGARELFSIVRELEGKEVFQNLPLPSAEWCQTLQDAMCAKIDNHVRSIEEKLKSLPTTHCQPILSDNHYFNSVLPDFNFRMVTTEEVFKVVKSMRPTAYKGDVFTASLIIESLDVLAPFIARLVNASFTAAIVPSVLKEAWITPLLKKTGLDPSNPLNYRPITNVSFLLKILDNLAHIQVREYLETSGLLNPRQSGFRKGYGTESALVDLKNNLLGLIDGGNAALLLLLDLSAAFDLVDHALLTQRLVEHFAFSNHAAKWVGAFLADRKARVFLGEVSADPAPLVRGVPQGSCLSPTLYNMYTRPLFDLLDQLGVGFTNYADDTQIFLPLSGNYKADLRRIQEIFDIIENWMAQNKLVLNSDKTEILVLGSRQMLKSLSKEYSAFEINGCVINTANAVKTLGVHLDSSLTMGPHVQKVRSSCTYVIKLIRQLRAYLSRDNLKKVAGALVNSRIDYCNGLLAGIDKKSLKVLQVVQNDAVRATAGIARGEHVSDARRELHWLPVEQRISHKICSLSYKCLHNAAPDYLANCIKTHDPGRELRSSHSVRILPPRFRLATFGGRSFPVQAAKCWNLLPPELRNCNDLAIFKKGVKTLLFDRIT